MFFIFFSIILVYLIFTEYIFYRQIRKYIKVQNQKRFRLFYWSGMIIMLLGWLAAGFVGRMFAAPSFEGWLQPIYFFFLAWHYGIFFTSVPYFVLLGSRFVFRQLRSFWYKKFTKLPENEDPSREKTSLLSRREFFTRAGNLAIETLPIYASIGLLSGFYLGSREVVTLRRQFKIANLHEDLKGLKIVHISDIHIGMMIHDKYLDDCAQLINQLRSDLILVTGDILDNSNRYLPTAGRFFQQITSRAKIGSFGIMGNHDFIDDANVATKGLTEGGLVILRNEMISVKRGKGQFQLIGLDYPYPMPRASKQREGVTRRLFAHATQKIRPLPSLLMNHHPAEFEFFKTTSMDLTLSGHTHGGQIMTSHERDSMLNFGNLAYKYYVDHYAENGRQLYVNRGLGHWFPLRINCPPEITFIELV